jgi:fumarate reductase flavoprotein subunit
MGVPADALEKEVADYNAALDGETLMKLSPSRRIDRHKPMPIKTGPYYGIPVCTGVTHIMGGIAINANAEVLDGAGRAIRGLYAVGTSTGGLEGGPAIGYLGGLTKSGVTGLRAAEAIAGSRG